MTEKAATPVLNAGRALCDALRERRVGITLAVANPVLEALGIDPEMPVEDLRERLAPEPDDYIAPRQPKVVRRGRIVWDDPTPENTDSPVLS